MQLSPHLLLLLLSYIAAADLNIGATVVPPFLATISPSHLLPNDSRRCRLPAVLRPCVFAIARGRRVTRPSVHRPSIARPSPRCPVKWTDDDHLSTSTRRTPLKHQPGRHPARKAFAGNEFPIGSNRPTTVRAQLNGRKWKVIKPKFKHLKQIYLRFSFIDR